MSKTGEYNEELRKLNNWDEADSHYEEESLNVNNHISVTGLIRMYQNLLANKKIAYDGAAHKRLKSFNGQSKR
jgi:hypothetical protein